MSSPTIGLMESAFAKLSRAKVHRDQLDADVKAFRAREPHEWKPEVSDHLFEPSLAVVKFRVRIKEETPSTWGLIVGDILTNLRAALDHAVYGHAAGRQALTAKQEKELNYPIIPIATDWPNRRNQLAPFIDPSVLNVIEQSQPFQSTQVPPDWHSLALLNGLVNRDKHRAVRTVSYVSDELDVVASDLDVVSQHVPSIEMTDGAVVASLTVRRARGRPGDRPGFPGWTAKTFHVENGYIEKIELPTVGDARPLLSVMDTFVRDVGALLNDLKAAGC